MKNLLGGKGANLAEMNLIGVPVPPGFTITTEVCSEFYNIGQEKVVALLKDDIERSIAQVESLMNMENFKWIFCLDRYDGEIECKFSPVGIIFINPYFSIHMMQD